MWIGGLGPGRWRGVVVGGLEYGFSVDFEVSIQEYYPVG